MGHCFISTEHNIHYEIYNNSEMVELLWLREVEEGTRVIIMEIQVLGSHTTYTSKFFKVDLC